MIERERNPLVVLWMAVVAAGVIILIAWFAMPAYPRDLSQWGAAPVDIARWYQGLMQPDNPFQSCCGEADAYYADSFERGPHGETIAIITDEREVPGRIPVKPSTRIVVPDTKFKYDAGNPTGHGVVFLNRDLQVYCYIAPGGV